MSPTQPLATRPARAGAAPAGGRRNRGLALAVIATAQLMVVLGATIVNVALPHIQHALRFSGTGLEWVVNAYAVTFGGLLLLGGRAGDLLGRRRGRLDLPGAVTGTGGVALLVYGLSSAGTDPRGVSHWADPKVAASLTAAVALLAVFVVIESRSRHALMPLRIFASRNRSGAYVIMLLTGTAMFGVFFFLTIFVQDVLGYSPLGCGVAFLPFAGTLVVISGLAGRLVARAGARPLMLTGAAATSGGMYWFSRVGVHTTYVGGLLGPSLLTAAGLGLLFVPLSLVALSRVRDQDSGLASSLLNTGQQVGGAIGLAALGTVAWTAFADSARSQIAAAARSGRSLAGTQVQASIYHNALAAGITRGFLAASGIALAALVTAALTIRISREDLARPAPATQRRPARAEPAAEPASTHGRSREASVTPPTPPEGAPR